MKRTVELQHLVGEQVSGGVKASAKRGPRIRPQAFGVSWELYSYIWACDRTTFTVHVSGHIFRECAQLILKNTAVKDLRNQHDPLILTLPPQLRVDSSRRGLRPLSGHRVRTTWRRAPEDCVLLKKVDSKKIVCDLFVLISKRTKYLFLKEPFGKRFRRRKQSLANPI